MVGSRVSSRIAQRLIKQEQTDSVEDNTVVINDKNNDRNSLGGHHTTGHSSVQQSESPKKPFKRHTIITSSPSSIEEDDGFDVNSGEDIVDDEEEDDDEEEELILSTPLKQLRADKRLKRLRRQKRADSLNEVDSARNKLDDLLAHISKGDSQEEDDYDDDDEQTDSSPHMKRRRSHKQKKDRKGLKEESFAKTSSFVLKLFDRSVDLAQFSFSTARDDAPLYPVCRSWIRNNSLIPNLYEPPPAEDSNEDLEASGGPIDEKPSGIYHLPKPLPKPKDKSGNEIDLRIPESVRNYKRPEIQADIAINSLSEDSFSTLLARNVSHWKQVRQDWQQSSLKNETRYKHSCDVLKSMFEKSMNGQTDQFKTQPIDNAISS